MLFSGKDGSGRFSTADTAVPTGSATGSMQAGRAGVAEPSPSDLHQLIMRITRRVTGCRLRLDGVSAGRP
jgi:hypothetical protein